MQFNIARTNLIGLVLLVFAVPAWAEESSSTAQTAQAPNPSPLAQHAATLQVGDATRAYLNLQTSNQGSAPNRAMSGDEASLVYHRYLESFKHAIPAFFGSSTDKPSTPSSGAGN
jgi:hypothetical protein